MRLNCPNFNSARTSIRPELGFSFSCLLLAFPECDLMDYGSQNCHYAAPPSLYQPPPPPPSQQHQQQQAAASHLYSSYYSTANPNPYPYQILRPEDPPASAIAYTEGGVVHASDPYAGETGYDGQAMSYGGYQQFGHAAPYPYTQPISATSSDEMKRKFKIQFNKLDLESKKQKVIEGGTAAGAVRICAICNVVCNSDKVFASHLAGEKHLLKAVGRKSRAMLSNLPSRTKKKARAKVPRSQPFSLASFIPSKPAQAFICEVCKIDCNSQEVLNVHKMGKKHRSKLLKLQQAIAPKPPASSIDTNTPKTANTEPTKNQHSPSVKEGLQVKKEKVLAGGAVEDEIMECALCDVVCNSKTVYDFHVKGKKHLSMVKKRDGEV